MAGKTIETVINNRESSKKKVHPQANIHAIAAEYTINQKTAPRCTCYTSYCAGKLRVMDRLIGHNYVKVKR